MTQRLPTRPLSFPYTHVILGPAPRSLFTIAGLSSGPLRKYAVTPDGQRVLAIVAAADATPHPATVILNWRAALGKRR